MRSHSAAVYRPQRRDTISPMYRDDEDEDIDDDYPDEADEDATIPCPHCGVDIYDDAERCPECGRYLSREEVGSRQPRWFIIAAVICLIIAILWAIGPLLMLR